MTKWLGHYDQMQIFELLFEAFPFHLWTRSTMWITLFYSKNPLPGSLIYSDEISHSHNPNFPSGEESSCPGCQVYSIPTPERYKNCNCASEEMLNLSPITGERKRSYLSQIKNHSGSLIDVWSHKISHYIVVLVDQRRLIDKFTGVIRDSDNLQWRL